MLACTPMKELSSYSDETSQAARAGETPAPAGATSDPAPPEATGAVTAAVLDAGGLGEVAPAATRDVGDASTPSDAGTSSESLPCDAPGELALDGGCYSIGAQALGWTAASAACADWGGALARLDTADEETALLARLAAADAWIGLNDVATEGTMLWEDGGAPDPYTHWATLQPDDFDGTEDCVELLADGRGWNDRPCTDLRVYVCER
jgi:hypothetical protein